MREELGAARRYKARDERREARATEVTGDRSQGTGWGIVNRKSKIGQGGGRGLGGLGRAEGFEPSIFWATTRRVNLYATPAARVPS